VSEGSSTTCGQENVPPQTDAERFLVEVEWSKQRGTYVDPRRASLTVGDRADDWLAARLT
jgi:hypothetical protein